MDLLHLKTKVYDIMGSVSRFNTVKTIIVGIANQGLTQRQIRFIPGQNRIAWCVARQGSGLGGILHTLEWGVKRATLWAAIVH